MLTNTFSFENGYLIQIDDILAKKPTPGPEPVPPSPVPPEEDPIEKVSIALTLDGAYLQLDVTGDLSTLDHYEINAYADGELVKSFNNGKDTTFELAQLDSSVPTGDYTIECIAVSTYGNTSTKSAALDYTVLTAPAAMTLRFEFSNPDYSPVDAEIGISGTWDQLNAKGRNIWDWTNTNTNWDDSFKGAFPDESNKVSVIAAGDTSSLISMHRLFAGIVDGNYDPNENLYKLISRNNLVYCCEFDVSSCTDLRRAFLGSALTNVVKFKFKTDEVIRTFAIFADTLIEHIDEFDFCGILHNQNLGTFDRCYRLQTVGRIIGLENVESISCLFDRTRNIKSIDYLCEFTNATSASGLFQLIGRDTNEATKIPKVVLPKVTNISGIFANTPYISNPDYEFGPGITNISQSFYNSGIVEIPNLDVSSVTICSNAFRSCKHAKSGILEMYNKLLARGEAITKHENCFLDCGIDTDEGRAALAQIPQSWGGLAEG